jgi:serine/threonine protein kinase
MGNQLIKNYDIVKEPSHVGGHRQMWTIYAGTKQDKSKQKVSIFQLDKKKLDKKI